ncbi:TPA: serine--tRNA ligase [archaeon]|jgi:seryl-tRNA synthetase|uniref:Serine--tRNA ligase n=1 Tax=Candidatus Undinarchaeum marinum TaxID=2756141 RepID=A0A832UZQ6_9ARCH|nr:serine--tRNA ligase [Candidatus Undinarchaeum marinum]
MIDISLLRDNPELFKDDLRKRKEPQNIVDDVLKLDKEWRNLLTDRDNLKAERNKVNLDIAKLKQAKKPATTEIKAMQAIASKIKKADEKTEKKLAERDELLCTLPNLMHDSVPPGEDDKDNVIIKTVGKKPAIKKPLDHIDLGLKHDLFDTERAAKTSGARFYFLKNEGAELEMALAQYAMKVMIKEGFTPMIPPVLVREEVMYGVGMLPKSRNEIFKIENEDLYLALTAEHSLGGYLMNETFEKTELPIRLAGLSSCFRTEAGSHGRDTKGIFRVHQFQKVEMFSFTEPEKSWDEHEKLLAVAEKLVKDLEIPYRVVNICTGDLGNVASKKYDIEAWLPGQGKYREIISCSNCTDYQARRLNIKYRPQAGERGIPLHTLNSTALALGRTIVAILENHQQADGTIKVPKVLHPYMSTKVIGKK